MSDTLNVRYGLVGTNLQDKDISTNKSVEIHINATLPLMCVPDSVYNIGLISETDNPVADDADTKNVLVDKNDTNRYVYMTTTASHISGMKVSLYYDSMFKDIIVIPSIDGLESNISNDNNYKITGYRVGSTGNNTSIEYLGSISNDPVDQFKLPNVPAAIPTTQVTLTLPGIAGVGSDRRIRKDIGGVAVYDNRNTPIGMVKIGLPVDVFGIDAPLPIFNVYQATTIYYGIKYVGVKQAENLYIPLDF